LKDLFEKTRHFQHSDRDSHSHFASLSRVSRALQIFVSKPKGSEVIRRDCTRLLWEFWQNSCVLELREKMPRGKKFSVLKTEVTGTPPEGVYGPEESMVSSIRRKSTRFVRSVRAKVNRALINKKKQEAALEEQRRTRFDGDKTATQEKESVAGSDGSDSSNSTAYTLDEASQDWIDLDQ